MPIVPCPLCGEPVSDTAYRCSHCSEVIEGIVAEPSNEPPLFTSSTDNLEGFSIDAYHGFVTAEAAFGLGLLKSVAASLSNLAGEESKSLGSKFAEAKKAALKKLYDEARALGANAVVGMRLDIGSVGELAVVMAKGTAVTIREGRQAE